MLYMTDYRIKRLFQIIPGLISWSILLCFFVFSVFNPLLAAVILIVYLIYWFLRLLYMNALLFMARHRINSKKNTDWLLLCQSAKAGLDFNEITHIVLFPIYKEPDALVENSLKCLTQVNYPLDKIIVVMAGEQRDENSHEKLSRIKEKFSSYFKDIIITIHPENIEGEIPSKGANATYAAKKVKEYLDKENYDPGKIIISCFDADTCADKSYFSCLTYHFITESERYQTSYQPYPIYSNNIYTAPAFARLIEIGSTFGELIESMRHEKFVTFSSHSMSFKTLVEADYWPVDLISDDSLIFWKCFLKFNGHYETHLLEVPLYMDIAVGRDFIDTVTVQYKQKRRWAYGIENFVFLGLGFMKNRNIPPYVKFKKLFQILDQHINWATWAVIISFISPFILFWGNILMENSLVLFNLSYINNLVFRVLSLILLIVIVVSREFLPPKPRQISRFIYVSFFFQWLLIPFVSALLGSFPALDAQTRLMLGKYLTFNRTPKEGAR